MTLSRLLLAVLWAGLCSPAAATGYPAKVVGVVDGDTLDIVVQEPVGGFRQERIRLAGIDSPERAQPFGQVAKQELAALCHGRPAVVVPRGSSYGRVVALVSCAGVDSSQYMVDRGLAWVYRQYTSDVGLIALERAAQSARRGLWSDANPVAPWVWRR